MSESANRLVDESEGKTVAKNAFVLFSFVTLALCACAHAEGQLSTQSRGSVQTRSNQTDSVELTEWLRKEELVAVDRLLRNISPEGTVPGVVVASPSRDNPPYFFHWVRDAALTMETVLDLYESTTVASEKARYRQMMYDFATFSRRNQLTPSRGDIGEPKYNVDGSAYTGDWGRPQNDGPALRASVLTRFAWILLKEGNADEANYVRTQLYDSKVPSQSVIKTDLEYVSHHWQDKSFDLWEEVEGFHFYTHVVQRRAMVDGAKIADHFGDTEAAKWYRDQARLIEKDLESYWNPNLGIFVTTIRRTGGLDYKHSQIDASTVLSILHGYGDDPYFKASDSRVLSTFAKTVEVFRQKFGINQRANVPGVAIGRYPEDMFAGNNFNGGNPWPLLTAGFGTYNYQAALEMVAQGKIDEARAYIEQGDQFLARLKYHVGPDGALSEQINRDTGYMMAAYDLTWSYSEVIAASCRRKLAIAAVQNATKTVTEHANDSRAHKMAAGF